MNITIMLPQNLISMTSYFKSNKKQLSPLCFKLSINSKHLTIFQISILKFLSSYIYIYKCHKYADTKFTKPDFIFQISILKH